MGEWSIFSNVPKYNVIIKQQIKKQIKKQKVMKSIINVLIVVVVAIVFSLVLMMGLPAYSVWQQEMAGKAEFAKAEQNRRIKRRILRRRN